MGSFRGFGLILLAALLAAAAGLGFYMKIKAAGPEKPLATVPLVVAAADLTYGTKLEPQHMKVVDFPVAAVPEHAYSVADSIVGQTTKVFLVAGEPILGSKLSTVGGGLSVKIPESMRASSVNVNEVSGVSGFILPGDRVDVIVTMDNVERSGNSVARMILQDVEVLAAGIKTETKNNKPVDAQTVTLVVNPKGAEDLALAMAEGKIHLTLRNPGDRGTPTVLPTSEDILMGSSRQSAPTSRPRPTIVVPPPKPVEPPKAEKPEEKKYTVIRGDKIQKQASPTEEQESDRKP